MIVVDVGCAPQGQDESIIKLIERFKPKTLYGFDPLLSKADLTTYGAEFAKAGVFTGRIGSCPIVLYSQAAWLYDGHIRLSRRTDIEATAMRESAAWDHDRVEDVLCIDFAHWLVNLHPADEDIVVKLDVEGAEFPLLQAMHERHADARVSLLLVEWHDRYLDGYTDRPQQLRDMLRCPVEDWH